MQGNSTLLSLTIFAMLASAISQAYGFSLAINSAESARRGSYGEPEFFGSISNCIMQLLGLYVTLQPALRQNQPNTAYARWSWVIALAAALTIAASLAIYKYSPDVSQLLGFLGSAMQAGIVLQLVWAMGEVSSVTMAKAKDG